MEELNQIKINLNPFRSTEINLKTSKNEFKSTQSYIN